MKRVAAILFSLLAMLLALPALLSGLRHADATRHMEVMTLVTSQETWLRHQAGEKDAWLHPTWNERPRLRKPPMALWFNRLAWSGLPSSTSTDQLIFRSRLGAFASLWLALLATAWVGYQLGGTPLGLAAPLALASMFLFLRQGRLASYDTHLMGWTALACALGLRAMAPTHKGDRSVWLYALLSGAAVAISVLIKGPLGLVVVVLPLVLLAGAGALNVRRWLPLAAAALPAALALALPWYLFLLHHQGDALPTLLHEFSAERAQFKPPWYYLAYLPMMLPWAAALVTGVLTAPRQRHLADGTLDWLPWLWFMSLFVLFSLPGAKAVRYLAPLLPAAALLAARTWLAQDRLSTRGRALLNGFHFGPLVLLVVGLPALLLLQPLLLSHGILSKPALPGAAPLHALLVLPLSGLPLWFALRAARQKRHLVSLAASACVTVTLFAAVYLFYVHGSHGVYKQRPDVERVMETIQGEPLAYLLMDPQRDTEPDQKFLLYARRTVPPVTIDRLADEETSPRHVIVTVAADAGSILTAAGYYLRFHFHDGRKPRALYSRYDPAREAL